MNFKQVKFIYEVSDLDYTSQAAADEVKQMIGDGRLVIVKNEKPLEPETLVNFYRMLGTTVAQTDKVVGAGIGGHGELVKVRKDGLFSGKEDGELEYHCAGMSRTGGEEIVAMYMHETSETGGDTYYTDSQTAFADLDTETQAVCERVRSKILTYKLGTNIDSTYYKNIFHDEDTMLNFRDPDGKPVFFKQTPRKDLVIQHPVNGKKGLYFPWSVIRGFAGITPDEQHELYYKLKAHTLNDKYVYRHNWDNYDIALSDQVHSLHRRDAYTGERELWRAGIWLQQ